MSQSEVQQVMTSSIQTPVPPLPSIVLQPVGGSRGPGDRITFTGRAAGHRPLSYQ